MRVDRIILSIVIIGVVENQDVPNASGGGSSCGDFKGKYLFVLTPAANQTDLLTDLVELAQSAIVKNPENEGDPVQVVISLEDFTEFEKKTRTSKVYKSHSLQCVDQTTNLPIVETNSSSAALLSTESSGKTNENSSLEVTTPLTPKTTKRLDDKMCTDSDICESEFEKNSINASLSNDGKKSLEATATPNTTFDDLLSSRIVRTSKKKKGTSKPKSKVKSATKFRKGNSRAKPKGEKKSARKNTGKKSVKKVTKVQEGNKKTTIIPRQSTQESWNKLMSMSAKSLTKSTNTYQYKNSKPRKEIKRPIMALYKLLSSLKSADVKNLAKANTFFSNQAKRPKTKNARKPIAKMSSSARKRIKILNARKRVNHQQKNRPKSQGRRRRRKSWHAVNPKIVAKNLKPNRDSRELKISAETRCVENSWKKRSPGDFTFRAPGGCTVIKISNSCDGDCSENNGVNSQDILNIHRHQPSHDSSPKPQLFLPIDTPIDTFPDSHPDYPHQVPGKSSQPGLFDPNLNPNAFEWNAAPPQSLTPESLPSDYELQEKLPKFESVHPNGYPLFQTDNNGYPWFEPSGSLPSFAAPNDAVLIEPEKDIEDADNYDKDDENYYDDDDDDINEEKHYEELRGYEKEEKSEIPGMTASEKNNGQVEDYDQEDQDYDQVDEDYDENQDYDDDDYVEENGNSGIDDEDDYNADED